MSKHKSHRSATTAHRAQPAGGRRLGMGRRVPIPILAASLLLLWPLAAPAGERSYRCEVVEHLIQQGPNGVIARPAAGVHFSAIRVEEYAFEAKKPFVLMEGSMVISGTCE